MRSVTHRVFRSHLWLPGAMIALAGCEDEADSPTAPASTPAPTLEPRQRPSCRSPGERRRVPYLRPGRGRPGLLLGLMRTAARRRHPNNHSSPKVVAGTLRFVQVSAGAYPYVALAADNRAYCWERQGGRDGLFDDRLTPRRCRRAPICPPPRGHLPHLWRQRL